VTDQPAYVRAAMTPHGYYLYKNPVARYWRNVAIRRMHAAGQDKTTIAELFNISPTRVAQILAAKQDQAQVPLPFHTERTP